MQEAVRALPRHVQALLHRVRHGHRAADGCSRPDCYPRRQLPALAEPSRLAARRADILPRDTEQMAFLVV